jgi:ubiquitin-conjugating enzyme E2 D/E
MTTIKRIQTELVRIKKNPLANIFAEPIKDDLYNWTATIIGPSDTPYENGVFKLEIKFGDKYPHKPPKINFVTKIYHPNVNSGGGICLDILSSQWSPVLTVQQILLSISSLMAAPNPDDPLVSSIAKVYREDRDTYDKTVREWTKMYAQ